MPSIPVGYLQATLVWNLTGVTKDITTSIGFDSETFSEDTPTQMATEIYAFFTTGSFGVCSAGQMGQNFTFQGVSVAKQMEEGPLVGTRFQPIVGTLTHQALPANCSSLVTKLTTLGGRRNKGRCYWPVTMAAEGSVDPAGFITPSIVTGWNTNVATNLSAAATAGYTPVLFHSEAPFTPTPISALQLKDKIATQRRRLR